MEKLSESEINKLGWHYENNAIKKVFTFHDFVGSIGFVNAVADMAESHGHHPDIIVNYSKVTIVLTTHDAGGVTEKDAALAREIDKI